jgi:hypothetical protein
MASNPPRFTRPNISPRPNTSPNPNSPANQTGKFDSTSPSPYGGKETPQNPLTPGFDYGTFPDEAVAEQNQTYFAYFDGIGGMGPEIIDHTAYFIKYIVDDKGNVVNPEPDLTNRDQSNALWNLLDNYESGRGKKAFVKLIEPNPVEINIPVGECVGGLHEITHVGRLANIAVTEIGILNDNYINTMSFGEGVSLGEVANLNLTYRYVAPANNNPDIAPGERTWTYLGAVGKYINYFGSGSPDPDGSEEKRVFFNLTSSFSTASWSTNANDTTGRFVILSSSIDSNTRIRFNISLCLFYYYDRYRFPITPGPAVPLPSRARMDAIEDQLRCTIRLYQNGNIIAQSGLMEIPNVYVNGNIGYRTFQTPWIQDWNTNDNFEVRVYSDTSFPGLFGVPPLNHAYGPVIAGSSPGNGITETKVVVEQQSPAGTTESVTEILGVNTIYAPYFTASLNFSSSFSGSNILYPNGSYSLLVLNPTASSVFELNPLQFLPTASALMNYSPITIPFGNIQPGDYIRFGYNENNVYRIIGVGPFNNFLSGSYEEYSDLITFKLFPALSKVPTGSSNLPINHFNIYRILNDGTYIVLKVKKDVPGGPYSGIIQPQYISQELVNNYNQIITNLTDREIIQ